MILLYATCVWFAWSPGLNATQHEIEFRTMIPTSHKVIVNMVSSNSPPTVQYCSPALYTLTRIWVTPLRTTPLGVDIGPRSGYLDVQWVWPWDLSGDGIVGFADFGKFAMDAGTNNLRSDANGDGTVDMADFTLFKQAWGECNNGVMVVDCGN